MCDPDPFAGRSILDLEAERAQLEYELDQLRMRPGCGDAVADAERRLAVLAHEIMRAGDAG